jgi:hypothetical protein
MNNATFNRMRVCSGKFDTAHFHPQVIFYGDDDTDCPCCQQLRKIEEMQRMWNEAEYKRIAVTK